MAFLKNPSPISILCLLSFLFISCQPSPKNESAAGSQIKDEASKQKLVYISNKAGGFDIFKNDLSGQNEVNLTKLPGWEWYPQFVREQGLIIFNRQDTSGNFSLKAMDLNGNERSFDTQNLPGFDISPNGKWAAYTRKIGESTQIIVAPLNAIKDSVQITDNTFYNGRPKWSNDNQKIAYISDRSGSNEIYVYDLTEQSTLQLTDNDVREKYLSWSPDDTQLISSMARDTLPNDLFIINLDTRSATQVTDTPINESEISWSPRGDYIAYHAQVEGKDDIFILDLTSKEVKKITDGLAYYGEPKWIIEK